MVLLREACQMVQGSVLKPTEQMTERETMEAFREGLRKCASSARELAIETLNPEWANVAETCESMIHGGKKLSDMKAMNRLETAMALNIKSATYKPH